MEEIDINPTLAAELSHPDADWCARRLLGATIVRRIGGKTLKAKVVETESYDQYDPSAHSYARTPRSEVMFGQPGRAYVYFIYGMYYCLNAVCGPEGFGAGVLIRAAEPLIGFEDNSPSKRQRLLSGPGKLCRALSIDKRFYGHDLSSPPLRLKLAQHLKNSQITRARRVGLSKSHHARKRFYVKDSPYISIP